ncbi:MAG: hypothetical protein ACOX6N_00180 [Patescibacteria group bacterium]|jgi:hypothetical protein
MKNKLTIITMVALATVLVLILAALSQRQDVRRSAYFASGSLHLYSSDSEVDVGDRIEAVLKAVPENTSTLIQNVQAMICYNPSVIDIREDEDGWLTLVSGNFLATPIVFFENLTANRECLNLTAVSNRQGAELSGGVVDVARINFYAIGAGSGNIEIVAADSLISGHNPNNANKGIEVSSVENLSYLVTGGQEVEKFARSNCNTSTGKYSCSVSATGEYDTLADCENSDGCEIAGNSPVLNFKLSFDGVTDSAECAYDWPLALTILGNGETAVYRDVMGVKVAKGDRRFSVYEYSVALAGFDQTENLAVLVKGPKHLQVKYAKDGQNSFYGTPGGELSLTRDQTSSRVYDFSGYPLLAGDVTGPDGIPDGTINGHDFLYVRDVAAARKKNLPNLDMVDLDGDCQHISLDVTWLMRALDERQSQLY